MGSAFAATGYGSDALALPCADAYVLVVDDDLCLRELLDIHLSNAGFDVRTAEDAVAAGRLVLERSPALIMLDVEMPFLDGFEFAAALKGDARTRDIPVAFLTSADDAQDRARKLGAVAYLRKPVLADRLLELAWLYARRT